MKVNEFSLNCLRFFLNTVYWNSDFSDFFRCPPALWSPKMSLAPYCGSRGSQFLGPGLQSCRKSFFETLSQERGNETVYPAFETVCDGSYKETAFYSPLVSIVCKILPRFCQIPIIVVSPDKNLITSGNSI